MRTGLFPGLQIGSAIVLNPVSDFVLALRIVFLPHAVIGLSKKLVRFEIVGRQLFCVLRG